jgi:hypothetical protein
VSNAYYKRWNAGEGRNMADMEVTEGMMGETKEEESKR